MPLTTMKVGTIFAGRYRIISNGINTNSSIVYAAYDEADGRKVALKTVSLEGRLSREFFFNEQKVLCRTRKINPSIPDVYDSGEDHTIGYFALEYVNGVSLINVLAACINDYRIIHRLPLYQVIGYALSLSSFFHDMHKANLVCFDVSPYNILLDAYGVRFLDFGLVREIGQKSEYEARYAYMSPEEVIGDQKADPRMNIFTMGIILWEMIYNSACFRGYDDNHSKERVKYANPNISWFHFNNRFQSDSLFGLPIKRRVDRRKVFSALRDLLIGTLQKNPENRIQTAKEINDRLQSIYYLAVLLAPYERTIGIPMLDKLPYVDVDGESKNSYIVDLQSDQGVDEIDGAPVYFF